VFAPTAALWLSSDRVRSFPSNCFCSDRQKWKRQGAGSCLNGGQVRHFKPSVRDAPFSVPGLLSNSENIMLLCNNMVPKGNERVRVRVTLQLAVYRQSVRLGDKPLKTHDQHFFFQLNTCGYSPYLTSSLRGWVCCLQLLLVLASTVILGSKSRWTHDIYYCLKFETPPTWRAKSSYLYPPGTGWPSYTPRHWVLFSSPPMTLRAVVEVFEPTSTQGNERVWVKTFEP
jgi:hypothetical protein